MDGAEGAGVAEGVVGRSELGRMVDVDVGIDGHHAIRFSGDGLILASPTGSSAHAVAAGGRRVVVQDTRGSLVWSEDAEVAVIGLEGVAVICSGGRVLVCPLEQAQAVRDAAKAMSDGT